MNEQVVNAIGWVTTGILSTLIIGTIIYQANKYFKGLYHEDDTFKLQKDSGVYGVRADVQDLRWEMQRKFEEIDSKLKELNDKL